MRNALIIVFLLNLLCAQSNEPQVAPTNPDFVKYQEDKKKGLIHKINSEGYSNGIIPHPTDYKIDIPRNYKVATLPARYDLRDDSFVTPVEDQGQCGSCWVFASIGSIESYWKKLGLGSFDLSEQNAATENGFEGDPCDGGNAKQLTSYLIRGDGPISEADDPYDLGKTLYNSLSNPQGIVTETRFLPNDRDVMKQSITDHGGIYSSFWWFGGFNEHFNGEDYTYFYSSNPDDTTDAGHAILLVGWDDNMITAGGTGAWIVKNSWGNGFGENGYFYISYQDAFINTGNVACWPGRQNYNEQSTIYYYDKLGHINNWGYDDEIGYALVKFTIQSNEIINRVGSMIVRGDSQISFDIWDTFNNDQLSGPLGNTSVANINDCEYPGYYSYELQNPINVTAGNDIYVRVKYQATGYGHPIPAEEESEDYAIPEIESNCFWISPNGNNGSWLPFGNGTQYLDDPCVKLYTTKSGSVMGPQTILDEGFDTATFPPTGWTQRVNNTTNTWMRGNPVGVNFSTIDQSSQSSAICPYDDDVSQEEYLYSPLFSLPSGTASLEFYSGYSTVWLTGATMNCWITIDSGDNWAKIWEAVNDGQSWGWRKQEIDLSAYAGNQNVALVWGYVGQGGDLVGLDGVKLISNGTVSIENDNNKPNSFSLEQNFPNPFNPTTAIHYHVPFDSQVKIVIYDILGHEVNTILDETKVIGNHMIQWNSKDNLGKLVSGGIYFYKLQAGEFIQTRKMILLK